MALWTPSQIAPGNHVLWVKAGDTGSITHASNGVSLLADKFSSGNDLPQNTVANRPLTNTHTVNGNNVIRFDGVNDDLTKVGAFFPSGDYTVIIALKYNSISLVNQSIISTDNAGAYPRFYLQLNNENLRIYGGAYSSLGNVSVNDIDILVIEREVNAFNVWKNGTQILTNSWSGTAAVSDSYRLAKLGNIFGSIGSFDLIENIVLNGTIDAELRQKIEGYLAHDSALQANLPANHPFKNVPPQTTDVNFISATIIQGASDQSVSVDVPSDADIAILANSGWLNGHNNSTNGPLIDTAHFGGTATDQRNDFTFIGSGDYLTVQALTEGFYLTADSTNWPGPGTHTLNVRQQGYTKGFCGAILFYKNVDKANPVVNFAEYNWDQTSAITTALNPDTGNIVCMSHYDTNGAVVDDGNGVTRATAVQGSGFLFYDRINTEITSSSNPGAVVAFQLKKASLVQPSSLLQIMLSSNQFNGGMS